MARFRNDGIGRVRRCCNRVCRMCNETENPVSFNKISVRRERVVALSRRAIAPSPQGGKPKSIRAAVKTGTSRRRVVVAAIGLPAFFLLFLDPP